MNWENGEWGMGKGGRAIGLLLSFSVDRYPYSGYAL